VNLTSMFSMAQAFAPSLRRHGHGAIVTLGSIYAEVGVDLRLYQSTDLGSPAAYAASKGGLIQLTRWLATVLAPAIRVNAVSPGGVLRGQPEAFIRRYETRVPLGRMATEADLKGAVVYLASDAAAYVTGQNLLVDGGWTAW
jgi:NAD(P)-dependent dehydrogenase (short-subunit alcohol dehydrogenase family)